MRTRSFMHAVVCYVETEAVSMDIRYRFMRPGEEAEVCDLVERVFNELVAPDYGPEGIAEFFRFCNPPALAQRAGPEQVVVVAEEGAELVGMIEMMRNDHIAMLFVRHRGQGIAKELLRMGIMECHRRRPEVRQITVNSSPFAEPVYRRMGFNATGPLQKTKGIIFVPMARDLTKAHVGANLGTD